MPFRADPWLHVIAGCMSSGKTDELLRLLRRAEIARRRILLVRPAIDSRTPGEFAESRSKARFPSVLVNPREPSNVLALARERDADMVGIEEAQFFDGQLVDVVLALRYSGRHVIASGLNLDFAGRPFGPMPELLAHADAVTMLTAICVVCGDPATRTQRLVGGRPAAIDDPLVVIGGFDTTATETYEARCHRHHEIGPPRAASPDEASAAGASDPTVESPTVSRRLPS
jgi:thymidine kinase